MNRSLYALFIISLLFYSCKNKYPEESFGRDLEKLSKFIEDITLLQTEESMITVSASNQARIFTSSLAGMSGTSNGWINWPIIESGRHKDSIAYMGGESRLWFGPEFGAFSIFFDAGAAQNGTNMRAPKDLDAKKFKMSKRTKKSISSVGAMQIKNASGFIFDIEIARTVSILTEDDIEKKLNIALPDGISQVAFSAATTLKNNSLSQWKKETGLLNIWELGCMLTATDTKVIIPLQKKTDSITSYFGALSKDRLVIKDSTVYFKTDAQQVSKLGISPLHCKNTMGSYSATMNQLTIVTFTFNNDDLYTNSIPGNNAPYAGDVINIFNGEVNIPLDRNWPFYEFESSSSAKELLPNEKIDHTQTTYHFQGAIEDLTEISKKVLGVDLKNIPIF